MRDISVTVVAVGILALATLGASQSRAEGGGEITAKSNPVAVSRLSEVALNPQPLPPREGKAQDRYSKVALNP
jgi:hypothetical protein